MLKILIDISSKQAEKVMDSLKELNNLIFNLYDKMNVDPLDRRKRPNKGDGVSLK